MVVVSAAWTDSTSTRSGRTTWVDMRRGGMDFQGNDDVGAPPRTAPPGCREPLIYFGELSMSFYELRYEFDGRSI